jgi:hypothetical protein
MTLTISIPPNAEASLRERALAAGQDLSKYVEQLIVKDIESKSPPALVVGGLDEEYARGNAAIPEDITEVAAVLPHLAVESAEWK